MNNKKIKCNRITWFVIAVLTLAFYYYCYRYVFQYNSDRTSPLYSDTPIILKLLKYPIMLVIYGYFIAIFEWDKICWRKKAEVPLLLLCVFCCYLFFHTVFFFDLDTLKMSLICFIPFLFLLQNKTNINLYAVCRFLSCFYLFAIVYEVVQLLLFYLIGRLPALAYENSISVRFGGPWDDPNGWGIALSFFIPFSFFYYRRSFLRLLSIVFGIIMLVLTQSLTAIGCFLLSLMFSTCLLGGRNRWIYLAILAILMVCGCFFVYSIFGTFITDYISLKQGSIDDHAGSLDTILNFQWYNYLVGLDDNVFNESDIVNILCYGGVPLLITWLLIISLSILFIENVIERNPECPSFWKASLFYQISFFIAQFNLPCTRIFYLYVFFNVILSLSIYYRFRRIKIVNVV